MPSPAGGAAGFPRALARPPARRAAAGPDGGPPQRSLLALTEAPRRVRFRRSRRRLGASIFTLRDLPLTWVGRILPPDMAGSKSGNGKAVPPRSIVMALQRELQPQTASFAQQSAACPACPGHLHPVHLVFILCSFFVYPGDHSQCACVPGGGRTGAEHRGLAPGGRARPGPGLVRGHRPGKGDPPEERRAADPYTGRGRRGTVHADQQVRVHRCPAAVPGGPGPLTGSGPDRDRG
jgi:hypothetical protein